MKTKIEMKTRLKQIGAEIRLTRTEFKNAQRSGDYTEEKLRKLLESDRSIYRSTHIAYSILKGKKYSEIENKTREGNEPNWPLINRIIETLERGE